MKAVAAVLLAAGKIQGQSNRLSLQVWTILNHDCHHAIHLGIRVHSTGRQAGAPHLQREASIQQAQLLRHLCARLDHANVWHVLWMERQ